VMVLAIRSPLRWGPDGLASISRRTSDEMGGGDVARTVLEVMAETTDIRGSEFRVVTGIARAGNGG